MNIRPFQEHSAKNTKLDNAHTFAFPTQCRCENKHGLWAHISDGCKVLASISEPVSSKSEFNILVFILQGLDVQQRVAVTIINIIKLLDIKGNFTPLLVGPFTLWSFHHKIFNWKHGKYDFPVNHFHSPRLYWAKAKWLSYWLRSARFLKIPKLHSRSTISDYDSTHFKFI